MKIVFAHNVYNRLKTLRDTIFIEKKIFPEAEVCVAYNDVFINIFYDVTNFSVVKFNEKTHKIGCVNGCILSIQQLLAADFEVLVFSHDDVRINEYYIDVVNSNIEDIVTGKYDIICRKPDNVELGDEYYMMEVFYISKNAAIKLFSDIKIFNDEKNISSDKRGSISPEVWLYNIFKNNNLKIKEMIFKNDSDSNYNDLLGQQMGFYHLNIGKRGWKD